MTKLTKEELFKWFNPNDKKEEILSLIKEADAKIFQAMDIARTSSTPFKINLTSLESILGDCRYVPSSAIQTAPNLNESRLVVDDVWHAWQKRRGSFGSENVAMTEEEEQVLECHNFLRGWCENGSDVITRNEDTSWQSSSSNC